MPDEFTSVGKLCFSEGDADYPLHAFPQRPMHALPCMRTASQYTPTAMHTFPRLVPTARACLPPLVSTAMQGHLFSFVDLQVQTRGGEVVRTSLDMLGTWEHAGAVTDIAVGVGEGRAGFTVVGIWGERLYPHTHTTPPVTPPHMPHTHLPL